MSVPVGTLTEQYRANVLSFFGDHFGWSELEWLRGADVMTIAIGRGDYVNVREVEPAAGYTGYEHFGLRLVTPEAVERAWSAINADERGADVEPIQRGPDGYRQFRVRYLLPMKIEVQHLPDSASGS
jgi:hypothetical protein